MKIEQKLHFIILYRFFLRRKNNGTFGVVVIGGIGPNRLFAFAEIRRGGGGRKRMLWHSTGIVRVSCGQLSCGQLSRRLPRRSRGVELGWACISYLARVGYWYRLARGWDREFAFAE